jgi:hypothetical protein
MNKLECFYLNSLSAQSIFAVKAMKVPKKGVPERCFTYVGFGPTSKYKARLKGITVTNHLAYLVSSWVTKSYITQTAGVIFH